MAGRARFRSDRLKDLIGRLQRIQRLDEMTEEDAYTVLVAAVAMNIRFHRVSSAKKKTRLQLLQLVVERFAFIVEYLQAARRWKW